jgi:hypothetical protein
MHKFGHDDTAGNGNAVTAPNALQPVFKKLHGSNRRQIGPAMVTTEGEKVKLPGLLVTDTPALHALRR